MCLERIVKMKQRELKESLKGELTEQGYLPISQKGFLYAQGDVPVLLVAHMDNGKEDVIQRVHPKSPTYFYNIFVG